MIKVKLYQDAYPKYVEGHNRPVLCCTYTRNMLGTTPEQIELHLALRPLKGGEKYHIRNANIKGFAQVSDPSKEYNQDILTYSYLDTHIEELSDKDAFNFWVRVIAL